MAFISQKIDPNKIGFKVDKGTINDIKIKAQSGEIVRGNPAARPIWKDIHDDFRKIEDYWRTQEEISWILDLNID